MASFFKEYGYLFKTVTFKRLLNLWRLHYSFYLKTIFPKTAIKGKPYALSVEPTTACNLACPECPSGLKKFTRKTGNISWELYQKIITENHRTLWYINLYFQGEPYIHPRFFEMIQLARKYKIYTSTSTNAHFLDKEKALQTVKSGLNRLIISLDGITQEVYEQYRKNGDLQTVLQGIKNVVAAKKELNSQSPYIILQFLVVKPNEHQVEGAKKMAKDLGVDAIKFKTAQVYDYQHGNDLIPENPEYSRYTKNTDGTFSLKNKYKNSCWRMWSSSVITQNGEVVPCCFDKDAQYRFGSVKDHSLNDIWKNQRYNGFREKVFTNRQSIDICKNCTEGTKVWS
jgi:radical SAM protein with 4Fe4S-binding SPASM domain